MGVFNIQIVHVILQVLALLPLVKPLNYFHTMVQVLGQLLMKCLVIEWLHIMSMPLINLIFHRIVFRVKLKLTFIIFLQVKHLYRLHLNFLLPLQHDILIRILVIELSLLASFSELPFRVLSEIFIETMLVFVLYLGNVHQTFQLLTNIWKSVIICSFYMLIKGSHVVNIFLDFFPQLGLHYNIIKFVSHCKYLNN